MKKLLFFMFAFILNIGLSAQTKLFYGLLPTISQTGLISKKFDYNFFVSSAHSSFRRTYEGTQFPAKSLQLYIQPSLIYKYRSDLNFAVSITYNFLRETSLEPFYNEIIPWQQVIYEHNFYKGVLAHRVRLEERLVKYQTLPRRMATRLIYELGFMMPLQGKVLDPKEFYINTFNEFYFALSNAHPLPSTPLFSENWSYIGLGYNTGIIGRVELGALYQVILQRNRRNLLLLQLSWITNFNPKKKK